MSTVLGKSKVIMNGAILPFTFKTIFRGQKPMIERRNLLKGAAAALTTSLFTGRVKGANDRIATGHIGIGAMGSSNLGFALKLSDVEPVAVCDVYQPHLEKAVATTSKSGKTVKDVKDFSEILDDKSIDAVCISTHDNWHA